ncbi:hypothetical protein OH76DRAFT_507565 [Lentinus brumalis]|uniref:Uncharacterized protein n=1 Tax=Lentinus brumalis TaxID=2498619 RepID=A0A371DB10_9APHY|nr:hypothetical protein OH76DRAFT_507565 [Polyporus brumalis]
MQQSSGKMYPRARTLNGNDNKLRGLQSRQQGSSLSWADSEHGDSSGIYLDANGQIDTGVPVAGAVADPHDQDVGVTPTSQLSSSSPQTTSVPVSTDVTATLVASSTLATVTGFTVTSVTHALPTSKASLSSASTSVLDPITTTSTVDSTSLSPSLSSTPLAAVSPSSTSTTTSLSSSATATSQRDSADDSERTQTKYLTIALIVIAVCLIVAGIVAWWVRMRRLRRQQREEANWPWGRDPYDARQEKLEGGLGIYTDGGEQVKRWDSDLMIEKGSNLVPPPPAHTHQRMHGSSPFVAVSHDPGQSVADFAQDMGPLHIRNLASGDISGGETSRASTALGRAPSGPVEYGTPFQPQRPAYMTLEGQGLDTPWAPLRTRKSRVAEGLKQRQYTRHADMEDVSLEDPLPYPGEEKHASALTMAEGDDKQDTWAASIRLNLYNVYSAVVGATPQASPDESDDSFTRQPARHSQRRRAVPHGPRDNSVEFSRSDTGDPSRREAPWTLEETEMGRGIVHIQDSLDEYGVPHTHIRDPFGDEPRASYAHNAVNDSRFLSALPSDVITRSSSVYSTVSDEPYPSRVGLHPPRLPSIANLSAVTTEEFGGRKDSRHFNNRRRTKQYGRPALPTRNSSQASATSVGSEMSRETSTCSDELTDGERFAKQILRERRKRMKEMSVGRAKTSRPRATMLSRRRSNLSSIKQRLEL